MAHWLITGGCGFIGTALIKTLSKQPDVSITVLDNLSVGTREMLKAVSEFTESDGESSVETDVNDASSGCSLVVGDILNDELVTRLAKDADVIVHLAANTGVAPSIEDPRSDCHTNVIGTFNVLDAARKSGKARVIFASSGAPLGEVPQPPIHEELPAHPVSPYGASKLAGEGYCSAFHHSYGVHSVALRFGNVYGPGSGHKSSVVAKFISRAFSGEELEIYGDGSQTRDFIYIDDLVRAIILSAENNEVGGQTFQIATNRESTVLEILEALIVCLEEAGLDSVKYVHGDPLVGDVKRNFSDISKAEQMLGWVPQVELKEGLGRTVNYFLQLRAADQG